MIKANNILDQIVDSTRQALTERKLQLPMSELEHLIDACQPCRDFSGCLVKPEMSIIAEVKRASPSKGWLCPNLDVPTLAYSYVQGGAAAISVLTEPTFFHGSLADLSIVREIVSLPLLRKDFIFDSYQVYEARAYGADAILLITAILSPQELADLIALAYSLGMSALVEVHTEAEVEKALATGVSLIGINNRNLVDFSVDLGTTLRLRSLISPSIIVVSESGIRSAADISDLKQAGVDAVLIGETLVTDLNPAGKVEALLKHPNY